MISDKDIEKLANLARIGLTAEEKTKLQKDVSSILAYVDQIQKAPVTVDTMNRVGSVKNVFREDVVLNETGSNTESLLSEAPVREKNYVSVKKILGGGGESEA